MNVNIGFGFWVWNVRCLWRIIRFHMKYKRVVIVRTYNHVAKKEDVDRLRVWLCMNAFWKVISYVNGPCSLLKVVYLVHR